MALPVQQLVQQRFTVSQADHSLFCICLGICGINRQFGTPCVGVRRAVAVTLLCRILEREYNSRFHQEALTPSRGLC